MTRSPLLTRLFLLACAAATPSGAAWSVEDSWCSLSVQAPRNALVYNALKNDGDRSEKARPTSFFFLGREDDRRVLQAALEQRGFRRGWAAAPSNLELVKDLAIDPAIIDPLTVELCLAAEAHNVEYDGWDTFLIRE